MLLTLEYILANVRNPCLLLTLSLYKTLASVLLPACFNT